MTIKPKMRVCRECGKKRYLYQFDEQFDCVGGRKWICKRCVALVNEKAHYLSLGYVDLDTASDVLNVKTHTIQAQVSRGTLNIRTLKGKQRRYFNKSDMDARAIHKSPEQRELRRKAKAQEYYENNKEKISKAHKDWVSNNRERARKACNEWRKEHPEVGREIARRGRERHPEKWKARSMVGNAIRAGKLIRGCCIECGKENAEAHHNDHSKPFEIIWLCKKHHTELHHNEKPI